MRIFLLTVIAATLLASCQDKNVPVPQVEVADTIKTVEEPIEEDTVVEVAPQIPMYSSEIFTYDTAYYVDPNHQQHKFVKYKVLLTLPANDDSDKLVTDIRFDIMNFATERLMTNPTLATTGYFASLATNFKTEFRAANEFSKNRYFDWSVVRIAKVAYQDERLYCVAKAIHEEKNASPLYGLVYSNWDKLKKEKIEYDDLFAEKDAEDIRNVLVESMVKKYGVADEASLESKGISPEQIAPSNKFLLTKDTIYFVYSPYELGMNEESSIKIAVANKRLRQYLDPTKSIVRYLLEN